MRVDISGTENGFVAGALVVVLLGSILGVLSSHTDAFTKLAYLLYDIGITGLSFGLLSEALDRNRSDTARATLAVAGALLLLALRL